MRLSIEGRPRSTAAEPGAPTFPGAPSLFSLVRAQPGFANGSRVWPFAVEKDPLTRTIAKKAKAADSRFEVYFLLIMAFLSDLSIAWRQDFILRREQRLVQLPADRALPVRRRVC